MASLLFPHDSIHIHRPQFLYTFKTCQPRGEPHAQTLLLARCSSLIAMKRSKAHWARRSRLENSTTQPSNLHRRFPTPVILQPSFPEDGSAAAISVEETASNLCNYRLCGDVSHEVPGGTIPPRCLPLSNRHDGKQDSGARAWTARWKFCAYDSAWDKGPPAYILVWMSEEERHLDKTAYFPRCIWIALVNHITKSMISWDF